MLQVLVYVHSFMSTLMIWKQIGGYIFKVVFGEISFAVTCSEISFNSSK